MKATPFFLMFFVGGCKFTGSIHASSGQTALEHGHRCRGCLLTISSHASKHGREVNACTEIPYNHFSHHREFEVRWSLARKESPNVMRWKSRIRAGSISSSLEMAIGFILGQIPDQRATMPFHEFLVCVVRTACQSQSWRVGQVSTHA